MSPEISSYDYAAALDACSEDLLWEAGCTEPPVDVFCVAERLGIVVARGGAMPHRARFVRLAGARAARCGQETIVIGPETRPERRQWAVAHEIGERLAHRVFEAVDVDPAVSRPDSRERVASHLASCLLLPRCWFEKAGRRLSWDLFGLKQVFATASHELIARRTLEMAPPIIVTLFDLGRPVWRRSNLSRTPPRLSSAELYLWERAHRSASSEELSSQRTPPGVSRARCWPVHEAAWKREIMRTEIDEWAN